MWSWEHPLKLSIASVLSSPSPLVTKNPLTQDTGQVSRLTQFTFPKFPQLPFINQPENKNEHLWGLHPICPGQDQNPACWYEAGHADHWGTMATDKKISSVKPYLTGGDAMMGQKLVGGNVRKLHPPPLSSQLTGFSMCTFSSWYFLILHKGRSQLAKKKRGREWGFFTLLSTSLWPANVTTSKSST